MVDDFVVCFQYRRCIVSRVPAQAVGEVQSDAGTEQNETSSAGSPQGTHRNEGEDDRIYFVGHPVLHPERYKVGSAEKSLPHPDDVRT